MPIKSPPIEKIYEAWSAIASGRVILQTHANAEEGSSRTVSSNGQKSYEVRWSGNRWSSNDNATYWQGWAGYPVLATLMLCGKLPYDPQIANIFAGINWNLINRQAGRDYGRALNNVIKTLGIDEAKEKRIHALAEETLDKFKHLDLTLHRLARKQSV